jgi:hypothetical protein
MQMDTSGNRSGLIFEMIVTASVILFNIIANRKYRATWH